MKITYGESMDYEYLSRFADLSDIIEDEDVVLAIEPPTDAYPYCFKLENIPELLRSLENVFENTEQYNNKENIFQNNDSDRELFLIHAHETLSTCSYCGDSAQSSLIAFNTSESLNRDTFIHVSCIPQMIETVQTVLHENNQEITVRKL